MIIIASVPNKGGGGRKVSGAGSYDMKNNEGIVTLTPSGEEDRKKGTDLMYEMMGLFESYGT